MNAAADPESDADGLRQLRLIFVVHNRHVLFLLVSTILASAAGWAAIYFGLYWLTLLALTIARGAEVRVPDNFLIRFVITAAGVCALVWWGRRRWPDDRPRDEKSAFEIATEMVLALPRATLAILDTLSAFQFLSRFELAEAWHLLQQIKQTPKFPVHRLPVEVRDQKTREKILTALQYVGLIEFQQRSDELFLALSGERAHALFPDTIRVRIQR